MDEIWNEIRGYSMSLCKVMEINLAITNTAYAYVKGDDTKHKLLTHWVTAFAVSNLHSVEFMNQINRLKHELQLRTNSSADQLPKEH